MWLLFVQKTGHNTTLLILKIKNTFHLSNIIFSKSTYSTVSKCFYTVEVPILIWLEKLILQTNEQCKKNIILDTRNFQVHTFHPFVAYIYVQFIISSLVLCFVVHTQTLLALGWSTGIVNKLSQQEGREISTVWFS